MKNGKAKILAIGFVIAAALAAVFSQSLTAWARSEGTWWYNTFNLTSSQPATMAGANTLSGATTISGVLTLSNAVIGVPGSTGITGAVTIAAPASEVLEVHTIAGSVTAAATPTISTASAVDGQRLFIFNSGTTGAVTFEDEVQNPGSGLRLDALTVVLQPAADFAAGATGVHALDCRYSSAAKDWACH